jgi:transposase
MVMPQSLGQVAQRLPAILEDGDNGLPGIMRQLLARLGAHLKELDRQAQELECQIQLWHRQNPASRKLAAVPGIGPLTASALVATVGDARSFKNARQVPAWIGLVPRQDSSGGKPTLRGISKRGDVYLRTLLIHGARAVIQQFERQANPPDGWLKRLLARRHKNIAVVALANKNARTAWALLAHDRLYEAGYRPPPKPAQA